MADNTRQTTEERQEASEDVVREFQRTGKIPTGYVFDGRTLSRAVADKEARATGSNTETRNQSSGSKSTQKKSGK